MEVIRAEGGRRLSTEFLPVDRRGELPPEAQPILARLTAPRAPLALGDRRLDLGRPQVMAILNLTPDSFSDGGRHASTADAVAAGIRMTKAGAAIIDIGGESTRPGAMAVPDAEEIARAAPAIAQLAAAGIDISIDTRKASVMAAALAAGAQVVNDVSALIYDPAALPLVAAAGCPVVLMHHQGTPEVMQRDPRYDDALVDIYDWLDARIAVCEGAGIARSRILVDPGIGFGKTLAHNIAILNGLALFHGLGCPIVLGASRKRIIGRLSEDEPVEERLGGSIALALAGAAQGAQILRVHDVPETVQALRVWHGLRAPAQA